MQSEGCLDWKIDPKDPKICRNCKKPKVDHQAPRSATLSGPKTEEKPLNPTVVTKSQFSSATGEKPSPLKSPNKVAGEKEKDMKSPGLMPRQLEKPPADKEKDMKSPGLKIPEKPSFDKEKDLKSPRMSPTKPPEKEKEIKSPRPLDHRPEPQLEKKSAALPEKSNPKSPLKPAQSKPPNPEKKPTDPPIKSKTEELHKKALRFNKEGNKNQTPSSDPSSEEEEEKKVEKKPPVGKNLDFKNKLEGLFKAGGNPMRMNDDCRGFTKKKSITPATLVNGKRASKTFEDIFDIQTNVQFDKEEMKRNLNKIMGRGLPGMGGQNLPAIPEMKAEKGKELREEMIKNMNDDIMDRPQIGRKTKHAKKAGTANMDFE